MGEEGSLQEDNRIVLPWRVGWRGFVQFSKVLYTLTERKGYDRIVVDLSRVGRAYPNGMVPMIAEIHSCRERGITFEVVAPSAEMTRSLFKPCGWLHHMSPGDCEAPRVSPSRSLPLERFSSDEELNDIVSKAVEVCLQQLVFAEGVPQAFEWALNEIACNVLIHSEATHGWIQVLTYRENRQLVLVVCDHGVGIPTSMSRRYSFHSDREALELAMRKGITSRPDVGQGNGLAGALAIAQHNRGRFAVTSQRGRVQVLDGIVKADTNFPPYPGTCVDMHFFTDTEIDLPKALWGHEPVDHMEMKFEDDAGDLVFRLRDYASSFGNRITGERIRKLVTNLLIQNPGHSVRIVMDDISVISSSFADELFGKLCADMGPVDFSRMIKLSGIDPICKSIVDYAITQRLAQNVTDSPRTE